MRKRSLAIVPVVLVVAAVLGVTCGPGEDPEGTAWGVREGFETVDRFPHDPLAFTQGLVFSDGRLFEGTGQYDGQSSLRELDPRSGRVLRRVSLENDLFGEGIAVAGDRIFQLTWQNRRVLVWNRDTFERVAEYTYRGEGWGLAYDGERFIRSDGTAILRFHDAETFAETGQVVVVEGGRPVADELNELEWIDGEIWANSWKWDRILRIDVETGRVLGRIDCSGIIGLPHPREDRVMNGIAQDPETGRILVTGKNWDEIFEIVRRP